MNAPTLEVADVFRRHGADFLERYGEAVSAEQRRVLRDLSRCRTAALGGHVEACDACGHRVVAYNSCRNRHCPKCQASARARWLEAQEGDLLPVEYFHVVFTLPDVLNPLALANRRALYGLLFRAAGESLMALAADGRHLGARLGFLMVLHTWGQTLCLHPHVHCVVPGGGPALDWGRWVSCRPGFFLPVRPLARLFRGKFLAQLEALHRRGELALPTGDPEWAGPEAWRRRLAALRQADWVVYAKPPFGGPEQVLKYLARYTHRVAISNQRLRKLEAGRASFAWKDYASGGATRVMELEACEFIRRFLLHVLPRGLVHIRHYGYLANRVRKEQLARCRELLTACQAERPGPSAGMTTAAAEEKPAGAVDPNHTCPACGKGSLIIIERWEAGSLPAWAQEAASPAPMPDTS